MATLDPRTTALVLIDLEEGIVSRDATPYLAADVVARSTDLAARFRGVGAPVVLVHVAVSADDQPSRAVDQPMFPESGTPEGFERFVPNLRQAGDIVVLKHHWGAFTGTDLDLQLRRRGITTVVIAGIATNFGVESTARSAWELSYDVVIVEDACTSLGEGLHRFAIDHILPRLGRVIRSDDLTLGGG